MNHLTPPRHTVPLAKSIRTGEGILVYLINLVLGLGAVIDPNSLPPAVAAKWAAIVAAAHVVSRTALKVMAVQKSIGVQPPIDPQAFVDQLVAEISTKVDAGPTLDAVDNLVKKTEADGS